MLQQQFIALWTPHWILQCPLFPVTPSSSAPTTNSWRSQGHQHKHNSGIQLHIQWPKQYPVDSPLKWGRSRKSTTCQKLTVVKCYLTLWFMRIFENFVQWMLHMCVPLVQNLHNERQREATTGKVVPDPWWYYTIPLIFYLKNVTEKKINIWG